MRNPISWPAVLATVVLGGAAASAEVPRVLGYQGRLLRGDGTAATGTASVTFALYGADTGGTALWQETQTLGLSDGYYSTFLGLVLPMAETLLDGSPRWLEVKVGSEVLIPRQQIGAVSYAVTAQSVAGGSASVSSLKVAGQTVIDGSGRLAGAARYQAGSGLGVDDATQTMSLRSCAAGMVLASDGTAWSCVVPSPGTVTSVAAAAPMSVTNGSSTPTISMSQAASNASGYLSSADWTTFSAKYGALTQCSGDLSGPLSAPTVTRLQSRPVVDRGPTTGQVLKWSGTAWEPAGDANSGGTVTDVTALAPLSIWNGTSTPQISILQAGAGSDGYLSSADWARFEAKYGALTQCGGDLDGTLASPVVAKLQGVRVVTNLPTAAQVLRFDGSRWAPASLGIADVGGLSSGYLDLSGDQLVGGTKTFSAAPTFGTPLSVASGGIGTASASAHAVFAGPASGGSGAPGFRGLVAADIPALDLSTITSGTLPVSLGGIGTATAAANTLFGGPSGGAADAPGFRTLVAADVPDLDVSKLTTGTLGVSRGGTGVSSPFTQGSVLFAGSGGTSIQSGAGLFWDNGTGALGIGTPAPGYRLDVQGGDANVSGVLHAGGIGVTGAIGAGGWVTAQGFTGSGAGLTDVAASAAVKVTDTSSTCTSAQEGQFRYSGGHFQGCNGSKWTQLDNAPAPQVDSVTPSSGPVSGGTLITIIGGNFQPLAQVTVGGAGCTVSGTITASSITCTTPVGSAGPTTVVVVNPDSQNGQKVNGFTYNPLPVVTSVAPSSGPTTGSTVVTITGQNFQTGATTATIGGVNCPIAGSITATTISCTAPAGSAGSAVVQVVNADGGVGQNPTGYTYYLVTAQTVYGGSLTAGQANTYQYSPTAAGSGYIKANWTVPAWATDFRVRVSSSTSYTGDVKAAYNIGNGTTGSATISVAGALQGAWAGSTSYYVTVEYVGGDGVVDTTAHSGAIRIAEAATWDGAATAGMATTAGGYTANFPTGSNWTVFYGTHYFETVNIASATTTRVQPFGLAESVPAGVSPSDSKVTTPKDGWLGIYANDITVAGTLDARGRGYGGGGGAGACTNCFGKGGANGLSGNGGGNGPSYGGTGRGGGGGGAQECNSNANGGAGGLYGGGGGGATYGACSSGNTQANGNDASSDGSGNGGAGGGGCGGAAGTGYGGGRSTIMQGSTGHFGAGGGGGYGAGGGGGACAGAGGGGGGTGGMPAAGYSGDASNSAQATGLGPGAGVGGAYDTGGLNGTGHCGLAGGYNAPGTNTDTSTDGTFLLGSGGGGGSNTNTAAACCEGGGGGGAGGGAIKLVGVRSLTVASGGQLLAGGASGGAGATRTGSDADDGGGGGGGGGGIVLSGGTLTISGTVRTLGGQDGRYVDCSDSTACSSTSQRGGYGGDGDSRTANGGSVKLFYGSFSGTVPTQAGRIRNPGPNSALPPQ